MKDRDGNKDFGEWLIGQQKRKDAVGELARWAKKQKGFRRDMTSREFIHLLPERPVSDGVDGINEPKDPYWKAVLGYMRYRHERKQRWRNILYIPLRGKRKRRRS